MRKSVSFAVAAAAIAATAAPIFAQTLTVAVDPRTVIADVTTPPVDGRGGYKNEANGGTLGNAQIRYVSPTLPGGQHIYSGHDSSSQPLTVYMVYNTGGSATLALSSVGLKVNIAAPSGAAGQYLLSGVAAQIFNTDATVGSTTSDGIPWDGTAISQAFTTLGGAVRAVAVPVSGSPVMYNSNTALRQGGPYKLAQLTVQGAPRNCTPGGPVANTTLGITFQNDTLLTTTVQNPSIGVANETVLNYGYVGGAPNPATANGNTATAASNGNVGTIVIQMKGDFDNDATVTNLDVTPFLTSRSASIAGTANVAQTWRGDFDGDGYVTNIDVNGFLANRTVGISCP